LDDYVSILLLSFTCITIASRARCGLCPEAGGRGGSSPREQQARGAKLPRQKYFITNYLMVFKMAPVRDLGFLKFKLLTVGAAETHFASPYQISRRSVKRYGDIAIFVISMMAVWWDF